MPMKDRIVEELDGIEKTRNVKIVLAVESGSRAWGFPSNDSDYDVRFIYVHEKDWYLTIFKKRDIVEIPIEELLDISGWDLRKSLQLMRKSNSPLFEWLSSPIRYRVSKRVFKKLEELSRLSFMPETSCYHYLSISKKYIEEIESNEKVRLKVYMYAIRATLCCKWIVRNLTQPPVNIQDLLAEICEDTFIKDIVVSFIQEKKEYAENHIVNHSELVENYMKRTLHDVQNTIPKNPKKADSEIFDDVFRSIVNMS